MLTRRADKTADRFDDIHLLLSTEIHEAIGDVGLICLRCVLL